MLFDSDKLVLVDFEVLSALDTASDSLIDSLTLFETAVLRLAETDFDALSCFLLSDSNARLLEMLSASLALCESKILLLIDADSLAIIELLSLTALLALALSDSETDSLAD